MANMKYFFGDEALKGYAVGMPNAEFAAKFPGVKGKRHDGYSMKVMRNEANEYRPLERVIEYKKSPSRHLCDDRCIHAHGKIMRCECACGGVNHGRGFVGERV